MIEWMGFLDNLYPWVKSAHVIFVIFWMAGLFTLPRYCIYHSQTTPGSVEDLKWQNRETRLRHIILTPSLILSWVFGLLLAVHIGAFVIGHWFHVKLLAVIILTAYHGWSVAYAKKLAKGFRPASERGLRLMNEVPGIIAAVAVILAIIKPF
ncbi:CopD family protein [Zymomonas sp.]|uniref:CopD family protein n=1 Tax=Zymomonas sp. TaxID=2068624 RepID=UPI0025D4EB9B|nr:CopD family protein [Zymomonas sp.]MCA1956642.1 CopD family protein [Zymomonas sp.]